MTMFKKILCVVAIFQTQSLIKASGDSAPTMTLGELSEVAQLLTKYISEHTFTPDQKIKEPTVSLGDLAIVANVVKTYVQQQSKPRKSGGLGAMTLIFIKGFGKYDGINGTASDQEAILFDTKTTSSVLFNNVETQTVHSGTQYPQVYHDKPLFATSVIKQAAASGGSTIQLYYGNVVEKQAAVEKSQEKEKSQNVIKVTSMDYYHTPGLYDADTNTITLGKEVYTNIEITNYNSSVNHMGRQHGPPDTLHGKPKIAESRPAGSKGGPTTYYYGKLNENLKK